MILNDITPLFYIEVYLYQASRLMISSIMSACKVRNEIETKRNQTKRNQTKRNEIFPKRNVMKKKNEKFNMA
jgi:hypothetical protein